MGTIETAGLYSRQSNNINVYEKDHGCHLIVRQGTYLYSCHKIIIFSAQLRYRNLAGGQLDKMKKMRRTQTYYYAQIRV